MHLTLHSDYALRVLIALGVADDRRSTIGSIAAQYGISRNHLMKVCHRLQRLGYVEGIRGKRLGAVMAERSFAPLGMTDISFSRSEDL